MADLPLPRLLPDDPRNLLSEAARRRISDAHAEAELIRTRALAAIEARYRSEPDSGKSLLEYQFAGQTAIEWAEATMQAARTVLSAVKNEFRAAGKSGRELRQIMKDELEAAVYSLELTTLQRDLLWQELRLYRNFEAESAPNAHDLLGSGSTMIHSGPSSPTSMMASDTTSEAIEPKLDSQLRTPGQVRPRRTPDLDSSRERLALVGTLSRELAIVKQELKRYCTADELKRKHPKFVLWTHIDYSQIKALVDGEAFTPKAYAESLTLSKFGLTSRETLKKDRRKLRKAEQADRQ